jgi:hypothetical protein
MPIAWRPTGDKPPLLSPFLISRTETMATMAASAEQIAILVLVLFGAALELQHVVGAALDHAAALCPRPARGSAAELPACCCGISFVVVGDAFQDSSSKKYCE